MKVLSPGQDRVRSTHYQKAFIATKLMRLSVESRSGSPAIGIASGRGEAIGRGCKGRGGRHCVTLAAVRI